MDSVLVTMLIVFIVITIIEIIIDSQTYQCTKEIIDIAWNELDKQAKLRMILLESELSNEDKTITVQKIEKVLVNDRKSNN